MGVTFGEDAGQAHERTARTNLATVRRLALNLLGQNKAKGNKKLNRFASALDAAKLERILFVANLE